jgi:hypothetical protein
MVEDDRPTRISDTKPVRRLVAMIKGGWIEEALLAVEDPLERAALSAEFGWTELNRHTRATAGSALPEAREGTDIASTAADGAKRAHDTSLPLCSQSEAISAAATETAIRATQNSASPAASTMRRAMVKR